MTTYSADVRWVMYSIQVFMDRTLQFESAQCMISGPIILKQYPFEGLLILIPAYQKFLGNNRSPWSLVAQCAGPIPPPKFVFSCTSSFRYVLFASYFVELSFRNVH